MRYYLIAGEASGDLHGSNLVRGLLAEDPEAACRCRGGEMMEAAGATLVQHYREGAVMGLTDVLGKAGKLLRSLKECKRDIAAWRPDAVILIDYPGFNMKIAKWCHARGIRVFYYIAPKTWASRAGRNRKLKAWVDRLFIVFPFEIQYFTEHDIPFVYKGNPLVDAVDRHDFVRPVEGRYVAMLAGSRKGEIARMMPVLMDAADRLAALPGWEDVRFVVAGAPARGEADYAPYIAGRRNVRLLFGRTYDVLKFADAAVINSGTASLEAALIGTPQVVGWSTSPVTAWIARHVLRVMDHIKFISLGNLCLDREVFRELIQEDLTGAAVSDEVRRLVEDAPYREKMLSGYAEIRTSLGGAGASRAVARAMIEEIRKGVDFHEKKR
ncbi:MAG: lipid-A-disaccharide synthase [Bacteroidales bacterium]|nr:lipid-A-disaccharide synthase [Bacteroidales bacterium]